MYTLEYKKEKKIAIEGVKRSKIPVNAADYSSDSATIAAHAGTDSQDLLFTDKTVKMRMASSTEP